MQNKMGILVAPALWFFNKTRLEKIQDFFCTKAHACLCTCIQLSKLNYYLRNTLISIIIKTTHVFT